MAAHGETSKTGGVAEATQGGEPSSSSAGNVMNSANTEGEKGAISASEGEDSSTSSSPPEDNPIRGTSKQRQIVRRMCRELYERPWNADELLWNLSQNRLTSMATARVGDQLRALGEQKREDIADALFNNAYSALMAVGTLSGGTHLQRAHDQLRADPLQAFEMWAACKVRWQDKLGVPAATVAKIMASRPAISLPGGTDDGAMQKETEEQEATQDDGSKIPPAEGDPASQSAGGGTEIAVKEEIDWDARSDTAAVTPPLIEDEGQQTEEWRDIPGPAGERQPVTPELLVDLNDTSGDQPSADEIVEGIRHTWPSAMTFATIFHNMTVTDIRREWGMPASPSTSEASAADKKGATETTGEAPSEGVQGEQPLEKDELVQQVMCELKQGGGVATPPERGSAGEDLLDIEIESGATIRPALQQAKQAGEKLGQQLRRQQEDRRRTLRVGGLTVKLPPAKTGEAARGTLTAKVKRVSKALGEEKPESLTARTKRVAAFMDLGDEFQPPLGEAKVRKVREQKKDRPPLRRRRHLSAC